MRKLAFCSLAVIGALLLSGCHSMANYSKNDDNKKWFLDPCIEFANYRTYGFLQVTAVRYVDQCEPTDPKAKKEWNKNHFWGKRSNVHHTDELIWRVLQDEMGNKGYAQVAPEKADLWVIYYGGPRPLEASSQISIKPCPFDAYFAQNELKKETFFVDVIDAKQGKLIYRGWDNGTFCKKDPNPERVINSTKNITSFFPSKR